MSTNTDSQETQYTIGADARCSDGACGEVIRAVIEPLDRTLTHLVIEPRHRSGLGRLVPLDLLQATTGEGEVRLNCTLAEFDELDPAEETQLLSDVDPYSDYGLGGVYGLGDQGGLAVGGASMRDTRGPLDQVITSDTLPVGEVAVRRGDQVHATDGDIGHVHSIIVAEPGHRVTHVLLQEGHLFSRKEVAIPATAITGVRNGIELNLTKQQVQDLPADEEERSTPPR